MTKSKTIYPASLLCDGYKTSHREQYPKGTEFVYSTWTPRTSRVKEVSEVVAFGFQGFVQEYLIDYFNYHFFSRAKEDVIAEYERMMLGYLGLPSVDSTHIGALHDLGFLPLLIKAVPEGTSVPLRVPMLTVENTLPDFYWCTNYIETLMSCYLWQPSTGATISKTFRRVLEKWADKTSSCPEFVQFQGHNFSFRGMGSVQSACTSGAGHLLSFVGTDTIPAISYLENYYGADVTKELVGCSVPASEHAVMSSGGKEDEFETYRRLIEDVYPTGIVSIVSDTWDLWNTLTDIIPRLKEEIMQRPGKVVIRPDSGDPVDIICGTPIRVYNEGDLEYATANAADFIEDRIACETPHGERGADEETFLFYHHGKVYQSTLELEWNRYDKQYYIDGHSIGEAVEVSLKPFEKGVIELLWDTFGGTINDKGYKELDTHIGAIYGDAITLARADSICARLAAKGFASTNIVFGMGSFLLQYVTRDSLGFALKATHVVIDGTEHNIFKDPITDDGTKKSQTGRVVVTKTDSGLAFTDGLTTSQAKHLAPKDQLQVIFKDGVAHNIQTLAEIRSRI